jgi:FAD/FMN-containing dehydrogenase
VPCAQATTPSQGLTLELPNQDSIFFKFQGNPQAMKEAQELTKAIAKKHGGGEMIFAKDEEESKELWSIRKNAHWSMLALVEGGQAYSTGKPTSNPTGHLDFGASSGG